MTKKLKLKALLPDLVKKHKGIEKDKSDIDIYCALFELASCHLMTIDEIQKAYSKMRELYLDINEIRVTELDDLCEDINMPGYEDALLSYVELLNSIFEVNGFVDSANTEDYDTEKIKTILSKLTWNVDDSSLVYIMNRLKKDASYPFSKSQIRILKRLQLVGLEEEDSSIQKKVEKAFPEEKGLSFYLACQSHANEYCREENPSCKRCPFLDECEHGQNVVVEIHEKEKELEAFRQRAHVEEQKKQEAEKKKGRQGRRKESEDAEEAAVEKIEEILSEQPKLTPVETKESKASKKSKAKKLIDDENALIQQKIEQIETAAKTKRSRKQKTAKIDPEPVETPTESIAEVAVVVEEGAKKPKGKSKKTSSVQTDKQVQVAIAEPSPKKSKKGAKKSKVVDSDKAVSGATSPTEVVEKPSVSETAKPKAKKSAVKKNVAKEKVEKAPLKAKKELAPKGAGPKKKSKGKEVLKIDSKAKSKKTVAKPSKKAVPKAEVTKVVAKKPAKKAAKEPAKKPEAKKPAKKVVTKAAAPKTTSKKTVAKKKTKAKK